VVQDTGPPCHLDLAGFIVLKKLLYVFIMIQATVAVACASSGSIGTRLGAATVRDGILYELYVRSDLSNIMMLELSLGHGKLDYVINDIPVQEVNQIPINGLLAFRLPSDSLTLYVGSGVSVVYLDQIKTFGSPIIQTGIELPVFQKTYISVDYRHQFNQATNYWFGGVGVKY